VHVGPEPLKLRDADSRYIWMPSLSPENFDRLLGSVDLFLSANISATTIGRAIAAGVPVLVVQNSCRADTVEGAEEWIGRAVSEHLKAWLHRSVPLYPFSLWPLGYWQFLKPLLQDNPYREALEVVELTDEAQCIEQCRLLLFDAAARDRTLGRHAAYASKARSLPTAAEVIYSYLQ
jgi:Family of unknown function (DUF6365)